MTRTRTPEQKAKDAANARARRAAKKLAEAAEISPGAVRAAEAQNDRAKERGERQDKIRAEKATAPQVTAEGRKLTGQKAQKAPAGAVKLSAKKRVVGEEVTWTAVHLTVDPETKRRSEKRISDERFLTRDEAIQAAAKALKASA